MATEFEFDRRALLKGTGSAVAALSIAGPLGMLAARQAQAATTLGNSPYGPLSPVADVDTGLPLLQLPKGFSYRTMSWTGDLMTNGQPTHERHDGMCCVAIGSGRAQKLVLMRNHESGTNAKFGLMGAPGKYSNASNVSGGTSNVVVQNGRYVETQPSLGGTIVNCAGGQTPWDTWLSCEETTSTLNEPHGWVFETRPNINEVTGNPISDMGRLRHEALAFDPGTGFAYLTEDDSGKSGLYRFEPNRPLGGAGSLEEGGKLYMAKVRGQDQAYLNNPTIGETHTLDWVRIDNPSEAPFRIDEGGVNATVSGPFAQGFIQGGMRMVRGEGAWWSATDRVIYIVDTSAGGQGALWAYDPAASTFTCVYVTSRAVAGNNPDNVTVSPRGGVLMCEDGGGVTDQFGFGERLLGLLPNGLAYPFAKNNIQLDSSDILAAGKNPAFVSPGDYRDKEWCGACFSPDGRILFVNIQTPGITFAITGPWQRGTL